MYEIIDRGCLVIVEFLNLANQTLDFLYMIVTNSHEIIYDSFFRLVQIINQHFATYTKQSECLVFLQWHSTLSNFYC